MVDPGAIYFLISGNRVSLDLHGKLEETTRGNVYVLGFIDSFTKLVRLVPVVNKSALVCAKALHDEWFLRYGYARNILGDRDSAWRSQVFTELCKLTGVHFKFTTAFYPACNSQIEVVWRYVKRSGVAGR